MKSTEVSVRVSVIVPTYNRTQDLLRCLASLERQSFRSFEVIVCDDGSTEDIQETVRGFDASFRLSYLRCENFGGPARARNMGIRASRGEFIAFLDSDDYWKEEKLQRSVEKLDEGYDLVYHSLSIKGAILRVINKKTPVRQVSSPVYEDLLANGNTIPNSSVVMRREIFDILGGITEDKSLIAAEDFDTWLQTAMVTDRFYLIQEPLGFYSLSKDSLTSSSRTLVYLERIYSKYLMSNDVISEATPKWMLYAKAVSNFKLGRIVESKEVFEELKMRRELSRRERIKILLWLIRIKWLSMQ